MKRIGTESLLDAYLTIPQGATFGFVLGHEYGDGTPIDHEGWTAQMRIAYGSGGVTLDDCVKFENDCDVVVLIPASVTKTLPIGHHPWDLMLEDTTGSVTRLASGTARVIDTYARDGV